MWSDFHQHRPILIHSAYTQQGESVHLMEDSTLVMELSMPFRRYFPTGALQLLWLGHHSARRAAMIDVCFAKTITNEEDQLSMRRSIDRLSGLATQLLRAADVCAEGRNCVWIMGVVESFAGWRCRDRIRVVHK